MKSLTPFGWAWLALSLISLSLAVLVGWQALLPIGIAGLTAISVATLSLLFRSNSVYVAIPSTRRTQEGTDFSITISPISTENHGLEVLQPVIPVGDELWRINLAKPDVGEIKKWTKTFHSTRRGIIPIGPIALERSDSFRLISKNSNQQDTSYVFITPEFIEIPDWNNPVSSSGDGEAAKGFSNQELSYDQLREYVSGDDSRTIHWPSSAKTGQLIVREFEETKLSNMLILLDTDSSSYRDTEDFELAVRVTTSIALREITSSRRVHILTANGLTPIPSEVSPNTHRQIHSVPSHNHNLLLESLSRVTVSKADINFLQFSSLAIRSTPNISSLVLITGGNTPIKSINEAAGNAPVGAFEFSLTCDLKKPQSLNKEGTLTRIEINDLKNLPLLLRFDSGS